MTAKTRSGDGGDSSVQQVEQGTSGSPGLFDALLELGDTLTLRDALVAWQQEQDRLVNRSWRRPGGLARPAGLLVLSPSPLPVRRGGGDRRIQGTYGIGRALERGLPCCAVTSRSGRILRRRRPIRWCSATMASGSRRWSFPRWRRAASAILPAC